MIQDVSILVSQLADREAIRNCLYRFCRGVDRVDADLIKSAFWPDATAEYGNFDSATAEDFIEKSLGVLARMQMASHDLGNIIIELDGETARVESYVRAIQRIPRPDGSLYDYLSASRYLDQFERRGSIWRIKHRGIVRDWYREFPDTFEWDQGDWPKSAGYGARKPLSIGQRKPDDASYDLFGHG